MSAQSMEALQHANAVRLGQKAVKHAVRAHELSIEAALDDPRAQRMQIYTLLMAQVGWGDNRTKRVLAVASRLIWGELPFSLREDRIVGELPARERAAIVQACRVTKR